MERKQISLGYFSNREATVSAHLYAKEEADKTAQFSIGINGEGSSACITLYTGAETLRRLADVATKAAEALEMVRDAEGA